MADYKRIVSYIYQYNHQVKGNNIGFTRVETRNGQCKIIVHVRVPNLQDVTAEVYTYCWYDGVMHGVFLGEMTITDGIGEFKIRTDADNMCDTQYHLTDMGGILVYMNDRCFLATEWDNRPVEFDVLLKDDRKPADFNKRQNLKGEVVIDVNTEIASAGETAFRSGRFLEVRAASEELPEEKSEEQQMVPELQESEDEVKSDSDTNIHIADLSVLEKNEVPQNTDDFPLSKQRIEQLDQQAQELFGNMLNNHIFEPEPKEETEQAENTPAIEISPKAAIEYFTAFKSCESEEEYLEVQQEIERLHVRIEQLERVCMEWKIKCARLREMNEAKEDAMKERLKIEDELRRSFNINGADEIYPDEQENESIELRAAAGRGSDSDGEDSSNQLEAEGQSEDEEDAHIHPVVERILSRYPSIEPFTDLEADCCVKIEPQDIGIFPMENWILANNSFLLHGYYSYRHLIFFCRKVYGKYVYLLGIPGVNHSRERFMANMFGFSMFQPLTNVQQDGVQAASNSMSGNPAYDETLGGEFGYWCMEIYF